jgi:hypothetical protein
LLARVAAVGRQQLDVFLRRLAPKPPEEVKHVLTIIASTERSVPTTAIKKGA